MRTDRLLSFLLMILLSLSVVACDKQAPVDKKEEDKPINPPVAPVKTAIEQTQVTIPVGMEKPRRLLQRTTLIGT